MNRRNFLRTLGSGIAVAAAPAIVKAENIMPVKVMPKGILRPYYKNGSVDMPWHEGPVKVNTESSYYIDLCACLLYTSPSPRDRG